VWADTQLQEVLLRLPLPAMEVLLASIILTMCTCQVMGVPAKYKCMTCSSSEIREVPRHIVVEVPVLFLLM
jgi:hypothetical protein